MTSLLMSKVIVKDAGNYKVTMDNENGQATFTIKVIVIGTYSNTSSVIHISISIVYGY